MIKSLLAQLAKIIHDTFFTSTTELNNISVFECNHTADDQFSPFAGAREAREMLLGEYGKTPPHPAVLLVGILPLSEVIPFGRGNNDTNFRALMTWAGAAYLQYGFSKEELCATITRIIEGSKKSLPSELLPKPEDILRLNSEVRHWLENRLKTTSDTLENFRDSLNGETLLHPSHLDPVAAIPEQHRQQMLNRLWAFDIYIMRITTSIAEFNSLKDSIIQFEDRWKALEAARSRYRSEVTVGIMTREVASQVVKELELACGELKNAIKATRQLDDSLKKVKREYR